MKYKVYSRIVNFAKHIHCQEEISNLAKQIMNEQIKNEWPGLSKQASVICDELGVEGLYDPHVTKNQFKSAVKKACLKLNNEDLINQIARYKKMAALRDEVQKGNRYFFTESLQTVRTLFRFRVDLFEAKDNFHNKPEYKKENFLCDSCMSQVDLNTHVLHCPAYAPLREEKNLNNDLHLAKYLQKVLEIRTKLRFDR